MPVQEVLILAVTQMLGGVCFAGMSTETDPDTGLRWIRPVREHDHVLLGDITTADGRVIQHIGRDNCLRTDHPAPDRRPRRKSALSLRIRRETEAVVLRGVATMPFPVGRISLARALKGLPTSPVSEGRFMLFGSLAAMTAKEIGVIIDHLEQDGFLEHFERGQFRLLRITESGLHRLKTSAGSDLALRSSVGLAAQPHGQDSLEG